VDPDGSRSPLIWVVEDDPVVRDYVRESLLVARFEVTGFARAEDVLTRLRSTRPDVIVLDLGMPRGAMQGMELLARLRDQDDGKTLPVIILSGYGDVVNREVTGRLGVAAILTKPLPGLGELIRLIREITVP
jgi:DNA-binding response OmpR family regulator